jgi:PilZ domain
MAWFWGEGIGAESKHPSADRVRRRQVTPRTLAKSVRASSHGVQASCRRALAANEPEIVQSTEPARTNPELAVGRFLESFQILLHSARLYDKNHPRVLESLKAAEKDLRAALRLLPSIAIDVERDRLSAPLLGEHSLTAHGRELSTLAQELSRCGVTSLVFLPETNLGELDALARLLNATSLKASPPARSDARNKHATARETPHEAQSRDWRAQLDERHISSIHVNRAVHRKVDPTLASLMAALLAYGGASHSTGEESTATDYAHTEANFEELTSALRLLRRMLARVDPTRPSSPQETARALHAAMAEAEHRAVSRLVAGAVRLALRVEETLESYVARLTDALVLEFVDRAFRAGCLTPPELRTLLERIGRELAPGAERTTSAEKPASAFRPAPQSAAQEASPVLSPWADELHAERLHERFWAELPARDALAVLRGPDAWCVPVATLRLALESLSDTARNVGEGEAEVSSTDSLREAGQMLLNYVRCLESEEGAARRAVAAGLTELCPLLERLWPQRAPEELARNVVHALERETSPHIAGLLTAVTENLARLALRQGDYTGFESILVALECAPRDAEHAHLGLLAARFIADDRWLLLVDQALAHRPLDPLLPRLLGRDPERLLDRLGLLLTAPDGVDALPAMARLLRAIGEPALSALERRLADPRRQRAAAAVKLLARTQPGRLVDALPRVLPSWDRSLQDLAVSELARRPDATPIPGIARAFLAAVTEAHPMVAPVMLDHIGLAQEPAARPLVTEIAAGQHPQLKDVFIRIKAVEALGRMRVMESAQLLRTIVHQRDGLTHREPAGLRAAAEEALALLENHPSSRRVRAAREALEKASLRFTRSRRYPRIPLPAPLTAHIEAPYLGSARVHTISLGGAFLESKHRLAVGDSLRLEIRVGLRRIRSTAVVRNVQPTGGGVEFVHMKQEDREKLRRLVEGLLPA